MSTRWSAFKLHIETITSNGKILPLLISTLNSQQYKLPRHTSYIDLASSSRRVKSAASSQRRPHQHSWWHRGAENTPVGVSPTAQTPQLACPRTPAPMPPVPALAHPTATAHRSSGMMRCLWDASERDSATSQSKPLRCISETWSLAPRRSPIGAAARSLHHVQYEIQTHWGQHCHEDSDAICKPSLQAALHRNQHADQDDISTCRGFSLKSCLHLSKACTLASRRHAANQLLQQLPPSKVSLAKRGTSFHAADVTPHLSPLRSETERMKLFFASCVFQDSVSRKKPFCATARKAQHKLPLPVLQPVLFSLQSRTWPKPKKRLCIFAKLTSGWTAN